jgi:hypothetical protein
MRWSERLRVIKHMVCAELRDELVVKENRGEHI